MKIILLLICFLCSCSSANHMQKRSPSSSIDGGRVISNGGDILQCTHNGNTEYLVLDYFARDKNAEYSKIDLSLFLKKEFGIFGLEYESLFESFVKRKKSKVSDLYYWKQAPSELVDIEDEKLDFSIPANCKKIQAIRRSKSNMYEYSTIFSYDEDVISKIPQEQISWLVFHELMWSKFDSAPKIRDVNQLVHQINTNISLSENELIKELKRKSITDIKKVIHVVPSRLLFVNSNNFHIPTDFRIESSHLNNVEYLLITANERHYVYNFNTNKLVNLNPFDHFIDSSSMFHKSPLPLGYRNENNDTYYLLYGDNEIPFKSVAYPQMFSSFVYNSKNLFGHGEIIEKKMLATKTGKYSFKNNIAYFKTTDGEFQITNNGHVLTNISKGNFTYDTHGSVIKNNYKLLLDATAQLYYFCDLSRETCFVKNMISSDKSGFEIRAMNDHGLYLYQEYDYIKNTERPGLLHFNVATDELCMISLKTFDSAAFGRRAELLYPYECITVDNEFVCKFAQYNNYKEDASVKKAEVNFHSCTVSGNMPFEAKVLKFPSNEENKQHYDLKQDPKSSLLHEYK